MKTWWQAGILILSFIALIWWSRVPLPERSPSNSVEILPAPRHSKPLVHSPVPGFKAHSNKTTRTDETKLSLLKFRFLRLIEVHPPEEEWDGIDENSFPNELVHWGYRAGNEIGADDDDLGPLAYELYPQAQSPYVRYVLFSWATHYGLSIDKQKLITWLASDPLINNDRDFFQGIPGETMDERVDRALGSNLLSNESRSIFLNISKSELDQTLSHFSEDHKGAVRVKFFADSVFSNR